MFAYVLSALLLLLPTAAAFPAIWVPDGLGLRTAPLFGLCEKLIKALLIGALTLGPPTDNDFRTSCAAACFAAIFAVTFVWARPLEQSFTLFFRRTSVAAAVGMRCLSDIALLGFLGGWYGLCVCLLAAATALHVLRGPKIAAALHIPLTTIAPSV